MRFLVQWIGVLSLMAAGMGHSAEVRKPWTTSRLLGSPDQPAKYKVQRGFAGISFTNPVDLAFSREMGRWFVAEQGGKILSFDSRGEGLDLAADFGPLQGPEGALYGIVFDPNFASNRFIYVCYALKPELPTGTHVSRFRVTDGKTPKIDLDSEVLIITWLSGGHNGGCLKFGKDGYLYISTGDAGGPNPPDPLKTGQDVTDLLSSILRIDVHRREGGRNYAVPRDNPFLNMEKARPEIWAYGLRNPWRMGIDEQTGDLWVADVGWELWELVYRVERGGNYGWSIVEGRQPVLPNAPRGPTPILPPTREHPHNEAASITGGFVYHGEKFPELRGAFIYGDWVTGKIWGIRANKETVTWMEELAESSTQIIAFAPSETGEIVVLDYKGGLYHLEKNPAPSNPADFPKKLSETGLFSSVPKHAPAPGVYSYEVTAPMWRDFATSERLLGLPDKSEVDAREAQWKFPSNAVLATTFSLEMERGNPGSRQRIETQILHFSGERWGAYSYRWNREQTDAELIPPAGQDEMLQVKDSGQAGGIRQQPWRFHSRTECLRCHNPWCGTALGFQPEQIGARAKEWADRGMLASLPRKNIKALVNPNDRAQDLSARARSYLHANCSHCHREAAGGSVPSMMNFDLPLEKTYMVNARAVLGDFGLDHGKVIVPGSPFSSVLLFRTSSTGRSRMPYLSSELVDEEGITLLREWIANGERNSKIEIETSPGSMTEALRLAHEMVSLPPARRQEIAERALRSNNPLHRELFDRFLPVEAQTTLHLQTVVSKEQVLALRGNAERGAALLMDASRLSCMQCHTFRQAGRSFGPDLVTAARGKTRDYLIESILEPSKQVAPEFVLYSVELQDDEVVSGMVLKRTPDSVVLRDVAGVDHEIATASLKAPSAQQLSAMPEGLLAGLTAQDAADLVEALTVQE